MQTQCPQYVFGAIKDLRAVSKGIVRSGRSSTVSLYQGKTASMALWLAASKSGQKYWVTTSNPIASSFSLITPNDVLYTDFDFFGSKQYT